MSPLRIIAEDRVEVDALVAVELGVSEGSTIRYAPLRPETSQ
jgi:hypothetical protein